MDVKLQMRVRLVNRGFQFANYAKLQWSPGIVLLKLGSSCRAGNTGSSINKYNTILLQTAETLTAALTCSSNFMHHPMNKKLKTN